MLAGRLLGKGGMVRYHYDSPLHEKLSFGRSLFKMHDENVVTVTR